MQSSLQRRAFTFTNRKWSSTNLWRLSFKKTRRAPRVRPKFQGPRFATALLAAAVVPHQAFNHAGHTTGRARGEEGSERNGTGAAKMSKLVRRVGNFFLDQAAKQYERSMTRKLNAFGERREAVTRYRRRQRCCGSCSCSLPVGSVWFVGRAGTINTTRRTYAHRRVGFALGTCVSRAIEFWLVQNVSLRERSALCLVPCVWNAKAFGDPC